MRYIRVYLPQALLGENDETTGTVVLVVDTEAPTPGNLVVARCADGVLAQLIADALNA